MNQNCNLSQQYFLIINSEIFMQSQVNKCYQYLTDLKTELAVWRIAWQWICDSDIIQSLIIWNSFAVFDKCIALCSMLTTQSTFQQLKRMTFELLNTSLTTISTQQQSQSIRMLGWFIRFTTTMFRRLFSCNQFFFTFKYDLKASYIISSDNEDDDYILFTDSENNCDACNFWELKHKDYSQSFVKN